jgi:hypothetical protein
VLFGIGAAAAYSYALPAALRVLFDFQRADLAPVITIDRYFGFAIPFILAFGAVTELPLVITILAALGVVTPRMLRKHRRWAIMIGAVAAALLSPPDALSMIMMLVPILLLYEVSILCAWIVSRRRAKRQAQAGSALVIALLLAAGAAEAQQPVRPPPRPATPADTARARVDTTRQARPGQPLDTAAARKLGLPTGPSRAFPAPDGVLDSLLRLRGFEITRYVADTLIVKGDSQAIHLRGDAFVERGATQLEADSIRFHEASCQLDARGEPRLFERGQVMVGEGMRYDTCVSRGVVSEAFTNFQQGGAEWYMRGDLAVDSSSTRLFGASSEITSCDLPDPTYHFAAKRVKWLNKNIMVARPAILYVRDVPVMWLPFIVNDIRPGRRSGVLTPGFGLNDLVRTSRSYKRHVENIGYYWAINDYLGLLVEGSWYDDRKVELGGRWQYRWLDRFMSGGIAYRYLKQLDDPITSHVVGWNHQQRFDSRTGLSASINYASNSRAIQQNTVNPNLVLATLDSRLNFDKRFSWGTLNVGGSRTQNLSNDQVTLDFPRFSLTPAPVNLSSAITWSPGFTFGTRRTMNNLGTPLLIPGSGAAPDTLARRFDTRITTVDLATPLRIGRWNWSNSFTVVDSTSTNPLEIVDTTGVHTLYGRRFGTGIDWSTGINLPGLFSGSWKMQPSVQIVNTTSAGPFMVRNQFTGGRFVQQGKRLQFSLGLSPTFFGFFPGVGPLARIRHAVSPIVSYQYAPGARVPEEYARAIDPTGRTANARTDPQQTITLGLSQNIEAKLKPPAGDTGQGRKIRLLSINTSGLAYNFEVAKQPGRTGWQTQSLTNTFASELLPGFDVSLTHDLWNGVAGFDTARFDPFLSSVSARFAITPTTLRGVAGLLGLRPRSQPAAPPAVATDTAAASDTMAPLAQPPDTRVNRLVPGAFGAPSAGGFSLNLQYSSNRSRLEAATPQPGTQQMNVQLTFSPTAKWTALWQTSYDVGTGKFGQHALQLNRDLRRWQATFSFLRAANGNFSFSFNISLRDQTDIKFDYDQQTYVQ